MEKFSNLRKKKTSKKDKPLYENDWIKVVKFEDWTIVEGTDSIICVPILMDSNQVVLRREYIPSYKKRSHDEYYLHVISGTVEEGESHEECLRRELEEEAGIVLRDSVTPTFEKPLFMSKSGTSQYHICMLPLYKDDYYEIEAKGDGSKSEKLSNSVKVYNYNIDDLESSDTITELCLMKLKDYIDV